MDEQQSTAPHAHGCFFCEVASPQIEAFLDHVWPKNTREHFRNAGVEVLKGVRSVLDSSIDHFSKSAPKGTKINVD